MISKIIQKEKERQDELLILLKCQEDWYWFEQRAQQHKQSIINLKEYLEEELNILELLMDGQFPSSTAEYCLEKIDQLKEDIKEIRKMIGRYE